MVRAWLHGRWAPWAWAGLFLLLVTLGHAIDGYWFFGGQFISEIKHGRCPPLGYAVFLSLAALLLHLTKRLLGWRRWFFAGFYLSTAVMVLGLMATAATSSTHNRLYLLIIALPTLVFFLHLRTAGSMKEWVVFLGLTAVLLPMIAVGGGLATGQKALVLALLAIVLYQHDQLWSRHADEAAFAPPAALIQLRADEAARREVALRNRIRQRYREKRLARGVGSG